MANKSGKCKVKGCNRGQQPGMNGYCSRCFKVHTENRNIQTLDTMNRLLTTMGSQLVQLSQRVDSLETSPVKTVQKQSIINNKQVLKDKVRHVLEDEIFIPKLDTPNADVSSVVTKVDINKSKDVNLAVKKLKIIQDTSEKLG